MLSPPWVESQGLSTESGSIKEIELPEDNARAMRFICAVIHHQNDEEIVKRAPSTRAFLHIAILTDKYDFHRALKFFLKSIMRDASLQSPLQDWTPRTELRDMGLSTASLEKSQLLTWTGLFNLTAAAYLLDDCTSFSKFSFDLMAILPYSFAALLHDDRISSLLPPKFAVMLGERASQFRLNVIKDIQKRLNRNSPYNCCRRCSCHARDAITEHFEDFVVHFDDTDDGHRKLLASILYDLADLAHEDALFLQAECSYSGEPHSVAFPEDFVALGQKVQLFKERIVLCLRYVRLLGIAGVCDVTDSCNAGHNFHSAG
ncbi:hypothetical protein B0H65DRAFT_241307 [Neurospora tetraspora]|uniref:Uncharacterized protein n=1 Tax=Neurospora tetraspora TaxID=94610 RepID=A0AAE0MQV4_9PEZI|nr:hypothetical protein B0H65DRAFT_241307 [Neurospora tetraspora]